MQANNTFKWKLWMKPRTEKGNTLVCHWNSLSISNFLKVSISWFTYNCCHRIDITSFSVTCLNCEIMSNSKNLGILGYKVFRANHLFKAMGTILMRNFENNFFSSIKVIFSTFKTSYYIFQIITGDILLTITSAFIMFNCQINSS